MRILQLGNGSAFNPEQTNSSFLIKLEDNFLLFDCGFNVFEKLVKQYENRIINLPQLKWVYISHMDDDHMGSLKSLIYYMYFKFGVTLEIISNVNQVFEYLRDMSISIGVGENNYTDGKWKKVNYFKRFNDNTLAPYSLSHIPALHSKQCFGMFLEGPYNNLFISGDTKAINRNEISVRQKTLNTMKPTMVFHDYSNWDNEPNQVHACQTDLKNEYSNRFIDSMYFYHNDEPYFNDWMDCTGNNPRPGMVIKYYKPYVLTDVEASEAYNNGLTLRREVWPNGKTVSLIKDQEKVASLWENPLKAVEENSQYNDWKIIEGV